MAETIDDDKASAVVVGVFGVLALLLAATGVFGVLAYLVSQRQREIAVRRALGAPDRDLTALVMRRVLSQTAAGLVLGVLGGTALGRWLEGSLFGVSGFDPVILATVVALLVAAALLASYLPARRATRVEPWVVLRSE